MKQIAIQRKVVSSIFALGCLLFFFINPCLAANSLEIHKSYKLRSALFEITDFLEPGKTFGALKNSQFIVINVSDSDYTVQFAVVYTAQSLQINWVTRDRPYLIPKKVLNNTVSLADMTNVSLTGLSSGPLIIPFKWRLDDKSLTGEATLGFYAGITFDAPWVCKGNGRFGAGRFCFQITPLVAAGLSQVSVSDGTDTEGKTGFTWASGFLLQNWADLNIGILYGQDRIGDESWEHEGDGWFSFMIGWNFK